MLPLSNLKSFKIQTSGHKNLCGIYAVINSILAGSEQDKVNAFQNMGLNENAVNEYFYESLFPLLDDYFRISDVKRTLELNNDIALQEILNYKLEVNKIKELNGQEKEDHESSIKQSIISAMSDADQKQKLIDEYCEFLFYGRRDAIDFSKFEHASRHESFYSLDEFRELKSLYENANATGASFLDTLDKTTSFTKSADGSGELVPSASSKFFANFLFQKKWQKEWRADSVENIRQKFQDAATAEVAIEETGVGEESNLSIYDLKYILSRLLPNKTLNLIQHDSVLPLPEAVNIFYNSGHYSGFCCDEKYLSGQREFDPKVSGYDLAGADFSSSSSLATGIVQAEQIESQFRSACMSLLTDPNVVKLISLSEDLGSHVGASFDNKIKFYKNKDKDSCLELDGNVYLLNRISLALTKADQTTPSLQDLEDAKIHLVESLHFIQNLARDIVTANAPSRYLSSSGAFAVARSGESFIERGEC